MDNINLITLRPIGRSGSVYLHNLFDSSLNIITIPIYFPFYFYWGILDANKSFEEIIDFYINCSDLSFLFNSKNNQLLEVVELDKTYFFQIDKNIYKKNVLEELENLNNITSKRKKIFLALHFGYYKLINKNITNLDTIKYIFLHEHYSYNYNLIKDDFPFFKDINLLRNPYESFFSFHKLSQTSSKFNFGFNFSSNLLFWFDNMLNSQINNNLNGNSIFIKIEDLNEDINSVLTKICDFIEVEFSEILFIPTISGIPSNLYSNLKVKSSQKVKENLFLRDKVIIEKIFNNVAIKYGIHTNHNLFKTIIFILIPSFKSFLQIKSFKSRFLYVVFFAFVYKRFILLNCLYKTKKMNYSSIPFTSKYLLIPYRKYFKNV